jgi:hypothetical protein
MDIPAARKTPGLGFPENAKALRLDTEKGLSDPGPSLALRVLETIPAPPASEAARPGRKEREDRS